MPGKSKSPASSWLSRSKKHLSSFFSPLSPTSPPQRSRLPDNSTGRLDIPAPHADTADLPPASPSQQLSSSSPAVPCITSSNASPSLLVSPLTSLLPADNTGSLDASGPTDTELSPASTSHCSSPSNTFVPPTANSIPVQPSSVSLYPSPPPSPSRRHPLVSGDDTRKPDAPDHPANLLHRPPSPPSHYPSVSSVSMSSSTNPIPAHPPPDLTPSSEVVLLCQHSPSSGDNTGKLDVSSHHADTELPSASTSHRLSVSSTPTPFTTNTTCAGPTPSPQRPTRKLEDSICQNDSSTHPLPPALPQIPQAQALTYQGPSHMFSDAHNFTVKDSTFIQSSPAVDNFMKELFHETIIGAEFDSSARDPPPRCHPRTRLAIIQRCLDFITQCVDEGKLRWVVGPAGVGKSAIMQMVTENVPDGVVFASIFLSVNGRRDGSKTIITIAYQLAVKCGPYRQFIRDQIALDPSLLRKSLSAQFKKFIVEPFISKRIFEPSRRFLIMIDGLDESDDPLTQRRLLELITDFCIAYPTSPIAWVIASRPEPHITLFFNKAKVERAYTKEEIKVDSNEACEEVQRYLRDELTKIKIEHPTLRRRREWPMEHEFTKIASAAGGLFAYAATVVRYIGDHGGPTAQLRRVLETIDATAKDHVAGSDNPMDRLDALYKRILSNVPDNVKLNTRKLLCFSHGAYHFNSLGFRGICNALGLTEDDAYDAICHLHAVMRIPEPDKADNELSYYHKSFGDFLSDFKRSGFSHHFVSECLQLLNHMVLRIVEELQDNPNGVAVGDDTSAGMNGFVEGHCDSISLSWPGDERFQIIDDEMRKALCRAAVFQLNISFNQSDYLYGSIPCFHTLTTRFIVPNVYSPFYKLRECAFDRFRDELMELGKLKNVPLGTFNYAAVRGDIELRFTSPTGSNLKVSDPWNPSCKHRRHVISDLQDLQGWSTKFHRYYQADSDAEDNEDTNTPRFHIATHQKWLQYHDQPRTYDTVACIHCSRRFARHFVNNADQLTMVFVDRTLMCYVEFSLVDPDDGVSEWRYRFLHSGRPTGI